MVIHIEICDVCKHIYRGGLPIEAFSVGAKQWDVGRCCKDKSFTVVDTAPMKRHLLARVEALIVSELALMKGPV